MIDAEDSMIDAEVASFKFAVQEAASRNEKYMSVSTELLAKLGAEVEARTIMYRRLLEPVGTALSVIAKWRSSEIDAMAAMQAISAAADAWDGGKS